MIKNIDLFKVTLRNGGEKYLIACSMIDALEGFDHGDIEKCEIMKNLGMTMRAIDVLMPLQNKQEHL